MYSNREKGDIGEDAALTYLVQNGYVILERNFSTRYGEIDIIARDKEYTVFIEVKSRKDFSMGLPCEAVNKYKQRKIIRMAQLYIAKNKLYDSNLRFDVMEVVSDYGLVKYLRLIKDAFQCDTSNS